MSFRTLPQGNQLSMIDILSLDVVKLALKTQNAVDAQKEEKKAVTEKSIKKSTVEID